MSDTESDTDSEQSPFYENDSRDETWSPSIISEDSDDNLDDDTYLDRRYL